MKFLLTSQAIQNDLIAKALIDLLGKPTAKASIVYIPTSQNVVTTDKGWFVENLSSVYQLGWKHFGIVDLAAMDGLPQGTWWPQIEAADVIFVGGGANFYLGYWMERSGLASELPRLLKDKVYVGSSAGSAYITQSLRFGSGALEQLHKGQPVDLDALGPRGQLSPRSLKLVDIEFRPHYRSKDDDGFITDELLERAAARSQYPLYAIDDDTALRVVDGQLEVVSAGHWHKFEPGQANNRRASH